MINFNVNTNRPTKYRERHLDLSGVNFGRLRPIRIAGAIDGVDPSGEEKWMCYCSCGEIVPVSKYNLLSGHTKSCGCARHDFESKIQTQTGEKRIRNIWYAMKARCYNPKHPKYQYYGGKGITICKEWLNCFQAFRDWSLVNGYEDELTIDRIDTDQGYNPENCRWITFNEQQLNKSNTIYTKDGRCLNTECKREGLNYNTIRMRIAEGNYTVDEAINAKLTNKFYYGGKTMDEWCYELKISLNMVKTRMCRKKETFRESMLYYANKSGDLELVERIQTCIPNERDADRDYYKPRSEEYRIKRREYHNKRKLFLR